VTVGRTVLLYGEYGCFWGLAFMILLAMNHSYDGFVTVVLLLYSFEPALMAIRAGRFLLVREMGQQVNKEEKNIVEKMRLGK